MKPSSNSYSAQWFDYFHVAIPEARTAREVAFITDVTPLADFRRIIDVCCGMGRHARALADRGYSVVGVERDAQAVAAARQLGGAPVYLENDVREYQPAPNTFDVAIIMSQSFGFFSPAVNREILVRLATGLRNGGRVILDLWNPDFFATREGESQLDSLKGQVRESRRLREGRLTVHLEYGNGGGSDDFDWQLFTAEQMQAFAQLAGLAVVASCSNYEAASIPSDAHPRIQYVLEK
jgi:SAM-dependent methyltransferase